MKDPIADIRTLFADAARQLTLAQAKDELLAQFAQRRTLLGFSRPPRMVPLGRVWRLGVFLLGHDLKVYATGSITRVTETGRPTFQSASVEERRAHRATAMRSGFPRGETVNFNAIPIELNTERLRIASGALFLRDDEAFVRWSHSFESAPAMPLVHYLRDRTELLVNPPEGT